MDDLQSQVASLKTEVRYLKIIIPSACAFVALLLVIFWGIERKNIGKRVKEALNEHAVQQILVDINGAKDRAVAQMSEISSLQVQVRSDAAQIQKLLESYENRIQQARIKITSVDHSSGKIGQYFNFDAARVDSYLGHSKWGSKLFLVVDLNNQKIGQAKLWRKTNGGSTGSAHGRWESGPAPNQWKKGQMFMIISGPQS